MCERCGFAGPGTCQEAFHELSYWTLAQPRPPFIHQLAVDAYGAQHIHEAGSRIGQLFGLMGLCMVCEQGATGIEVQMAHTTKSQDPRRSDWPRIEAIPSRFTMNVGDVLCDDDKEAAIRKWVACTWQDFVASHETIRRFLSS